MMMTYLLKLLIIIIILANVFGILINVLGIDNKRDTYFNLIIHPYWMLIGFLLFVFTLPLITCYTNSKNFLVNSIDYEKQKIEILNKRIEQENSKYTSEERIMFYKNEKQRREEKIKSFQEKLNKKLSPSKK